MFENGFVSEIKYIKPDNCEKYPYNLGVVQNLESLKLDDKVTFFVGENGSGKSTIIEAIAIKYGFNPEGGSLNFNFETMNSASELYKNIKLVKTARKARDGYFLRAESFYNVATNIEELDKYPAAAPPVILSYGGVSLHKQSHGEAFMALVTNRFSGNGFYVLDEPEAALSQEKQLALLGRIDELVRSNSQFVIATHSPILLSYPDATIYHIGDGGIEKRKYEDTDQYKFTKLFINNYKSILDKMIER